MLDIWMELIVSVVMMKCVSILFATVQQDRWSQDYLSVPPTKFGDCAICWVVPVLGEQSSQKNTMLLTIFISFGTK
ncbi:hypothetical protein A4F85_06635 [Delftia sp. GW456-R20]|nr:hypothetical protein A4F85_06635 [Delftia sp. GW456-R20]